MTTKSESSHRNVYRTIWRWHFYAGLIIAPVLLILAITGGIYLFKGNIESVIYSDYYEVEPNTTGITLPPSELIFNAITAYDYVDSVISYSPNEVATKSVEVGVAFQDGSSGTIFMNPYSGKELGLLLDNERVMDRLIELHSELMVGTFGDRLVELAASWTIILLISGVYLWWPRRPKSNVSVYGSLDLIRGSV
ncbi:PepSY domain-containing protein [Bacillus sp. JCM 19041]|uniref:PepSY-associated TM helix domain-containing protein n=1 Tax=Bacillus sp. JCM 19041 TaxID=1460637 RepID=UPI000AC32659